MKILPWLAGALCACSAPIHVATPVEVPKAGEIQVGAGIGGTGSTEAINLIDAATSEAKRIVAGQWKCADTQNRSDCLPSLKLRDPLVGAYALGVAGALDFHAELAGLYGLGGGLAVGGRLGTLGQRVEVLWQAIGRPNAEDMASGGMLTFFAAYSHHVAEAPSILADVLSLLQFTESKRHAAHVGFQFGRRLGKWGWWQAGPHAIFAHHDIGVTPEIPILDEIAQQVVTTTIPRTQFSGWSQHYGGNVAIWIGHKPLWVGIEGAASYVMADVEILGKTEKIRALQLMPTFNAAFRW